MYRLRTWLASLLCISALAHAAFVPLPVDQAFAFKAHAAEQIIQLNWHIEPGYFLYHDQFHYQVIQPKSAKIGRILTPTSDTLNRMGESLPIYRNQLQIAVPILSPDSNDVILDVSYQGCTDIGFCYPPEHKRIQLNILNEQIKTSPPPQTAQARIQSLLENASLPLLLLSFLGFGLLLAFTPCVLPMIPILTAIIAGQKQLASKRALLLSSTYVLSMSLTYAVAGAIAGYVGTNLQAAMQSAWVLLPFTMLITLMALALFDCYQFQLPASWQDKLNTLAQHQQGGSIWRVAGMGIIATLVVSPCVTPPLIGALAYISHTGNVILGGSALFALGLGMGLPLIAIGWFGPQLLPTSGPWMNTIKHLLGLAMLGLAISLLSRLIPELATQLLWTLLALGLSIYCFVSFHPHSKIAKSGLLLIGILGLLTTGYLAEDAWQCWQQQRPGQAQHSDGFVVITRADAATHLIETSHQPVLLDFYADWCTSCKLIEKHVLRDPAVRQALRGWLLIRADVTANDHDSKALLKRYQAIAPPTFLFFSAHDKQHPTTTLVGDITKADLLAALRSTAP